MSQTLSQFTKEDSGLDFKLQSSLNVFWSVVLQKIIIYP